MTDKIVNASYTRVLKAYEALAKKADRDAVARGTELAKRIRTQTKRRLAKSPPETDVE